MSSCQTLTMCVVLKLSLSIHPDTWDQLLSVSVANPTCEISTILESFLDFQGLLASGGYEQKAGLSARETGAGVGYEYTDPLQSAANPQQTGQMSNVPSQVLIPTPAESHWVQLLDFCKELEECHLYWFA